MTTPTSTAAITFQAGEDFARSMDAADPLRQWRSQFAIPPASAAGDPDKVREFIRAAHPGLAAEPRAVYLTGNSLGLMPRTVPDAIKRHLDDWAGLAVEGHFHGHDPWKPYEQGFREVAARLVGARPGEVVVMNSLTVNLHLLMVSFYRPRGPRTKIMLEDAAFPSDSYAFATQARLHGLAPEHALIRLKPRAGEDTLRTEDIEAAIREHGPELALVCLGGVNYRTGQWFDMQRITAAGHAAGAMVGWDLAHAAGNVPLSLHDWDADFAAWCSYKFLNSGPGAVAGAFVHEKHAKRHDLPRMAGWWGHNLSTRFKMGPDFEPMDGAEGWQISNPPILSSVPLRESLAIFDRVGIPALREKSVKLTGYLEWLIDQRLAGRVRSITPRDPAQRGCALSLVVAGDGRQTLAGLKKRGVICDFREPNVIRAAPVPLYNSFTDVWQFVRALEEVVP